MLVRIIPSSSTSTTDGLRFSGTLSRLLLFHRNSDVECRAVPPLALEPYGAMMILGDDPLYDREAQAGTDADRLGGKPALQNLIAILRPDSGTGVLDPDVNGIALETRPGRDLALTLNRLRGVRDQVENCLAQQVRVAFDFRQRAEIGFHREPGAELRA